MRSLQTKLVWILLAVAVLLLLIAAASAAIYFLVRQQPAALANWQDPIAQVDPAEVSPDLALYPLAGALQLDSIDAAIANGDLETAYAGLAFALDLSDAQRIGRQILLGERFAGADRPERAALSYHQIYDVAILSPNLSDPARADALLAIGKGWAELGQEAQALGAYDQVYLMAVHSPYLQNAHRRELLQMLETAYRDLGAGESAEASRQRIIVLDEDPRPQPPATPVGSPDLPVDVEPISSAEVGVLEENRRQAAFALLQSLAAGVEPPADQVNALARALQAEDAAKLALYSQELEATSQQSRRINAHWHVIRWLMLKYQVAKGALGLSIVPDWEAQITDIQSALSMAYEDLFFDYEDLVTAQPDAAMMGPGRYKVRRLVTQAGRLGLYPNYPEQQMADKIRDAVGELLAAGMVDQLYVDARAQDGGLRFLLSPADEYGLPAQEP